MKVYLKILGGLLLAVSFTSFAQVENSETEGPENVQAMVKKLNSAILELRFISERIDDVEQTDREALVFRRDIRSFRLLSDFDILAGQVALLPEQSPYRETIKTQLTELSERVGDAIFSRISEIEKRIAEASAELESLSGGALVASRAYFQGLEDIRIKYYEALLRHIKSRQVLGLSADDLRNRVIPKITIYVEVLAGRIEYTAAAQMKVHARAKQAPADTDIKAAMLDLDSRHRMNLYRLETIIPVLDGLGLDSARYKAILLQQAGSISVKLFSSQALFSVLGEAWVAIKNTFKANAPNLFFQFLIFIAVLFFFRILSRMTRRIVRAASDRSSLAMSHLLKNMLVSMSGGTVMAIGVLMALSQIGISLAPMLAGLGVAGFIIGFAMQDSLSNFAAGAMILIYRPYDVNDFIEVTGASGLVKKMNLVSTTITTFDNQTLVVPNSKIWGDVIKNVTAQNERRVDLEFSIGYDDDIELAERIFKEIVSAHEKVLKDPEPNIRLHKLDDSAVIFIVRPWARTEDYWSVYWDITRAVKLRLDQEGITIPYPQRDVHLYTTPES